MEELEATLQAEAAPAPASTPAAVDVVAETADGAAQYTVAIEFSLPDVDENLQVKISKGAA